MYVVTSGNRYGRNHTTLNPDDKSETFWQFSWDEMALSDLPSMIHYVLDTTHYPSLGYVRTTIILFSTL